VPTLLILVGLSLLTVSAFNAPQPPLLLSPRMFNPSFPAAERNVLPWQLFPAEHEHESPSGGGGGGAGGGGGGGGGGPAARDGAPFSSSAFANEIGAALALNPFTTPLNVSGLATASPSSGAGAGAAATAVSRASEAAVEGEGRAAAAAAPIVVSDQFGTCADATPPALRSLSNYLLGARDAPSQRGASVYGALSFGAAVNASHVTYNVMVNASAVHGPVKSAVFTRLSAQ